MPPVLISPPQQNCLQMMDFESCGGLYVVTQLICRILNAGWLHVNLLLIYVFYFILFCGRKFYFIRILKSLQLTL